MMARFVGGVANGERRFVVHATRRYCFPVAPKSASLEDYLNLDYKPEYKTDLYRRVWYDSEYDEAVYLYERTA